MNKYGKGKVVLGLSGGMDSATLLGFYLNKGYDVIPVQFDYGSKHGRYERNAAVRLVSHYGLLCTFVNVGFINDLFKSSLLQTGGEIPEGHYQDASMSQTVVPGRNVIFISIMMGLAWSKEAGLVAVGVHSGDHAIYEDCREEFVSAMNTAVILGSGSRVKLEAPFQGMNKTDILRLGYELGVPYNLTRTCYKDQLLSCGKCGSCQERLEAFRNIGVKDPIEYEG
jgi:7-cyano-7-deazaguanine synthase